jgi:uncharacterized protein (DUF433 family)
MKPIRDVVEVNQEILGGQAVFKGTRVPVETLFDYLESGESLEFFLAEFPSVSREQALAVLEIASRMISNNNFIQLYEAAA